MKIKQFILGFTILALSLLFFACNSSDNTVSITGASKDAQIYQFSVKTGKQYTAADTVAYPILDEAKFIIDQKKGLIYNSDSLAHKTRIATFLPEITFSRYGVSKVSIAYKADSIGAWDIGDSINFDIVRHLEVTSADGNYTSRYSIDFRIHQVDPDSIIWKDMPSSSFTVNSQKTVAKGEVFFSYHLSNNQIYVAMFDKSAWTARQATTLPSNTDIRSITSFNNMIFARDKSGKAYSSTDGYAWNALSNTDGLLVLSILGVLPGKTEADDQLITMVTKSASLNKDAEYLYAKTMDMSNFEYAILNGASVGKESVVNPLLLYRNFNSVTDRSKTNSALLLTGGIKSFAQDGDSSSMTNKTITLQNNGSKLEVTPINLGEISLITAQDNLATFPYNKGLYALNDSIFVASQSLGGKWEKVNVKQDLPKSFIKGTGQSVLVDTQNYIWVFGGKANDKIHVWRGRLNTLNPK